MKSLIDYSLNEEYEKVKRLGDRLAEVDSLHGSEMENRCDGGGLRGIRSQWHLLFMMGSGSGFDRWGRGKSKFSKTYKLPCEKIMWIVRRGDGTGQV